MKNSNTKKGSYSYISTTATTKLHVVGFKTNKQFLLSEQNVSIRTVELRNYFSLLI